MKLIQLIIILGLLSTGTIIAQECGPNCPACSGAGSSSGSLVENKTMIVSTLSIPDAEEETTVMNFRYGLLSWLDAGVGYAFKTDKVLWNVRTQPIIEKKGSLRPGLIVGSGSVQTGGADQSLYMQMIKTIDINQRHLTIKLI